MTCFRIIKRSFRVVLQLLNKTMQKLSVILSKRDPTAFLEKGGPRRPPSSPPLIATLALIYMQKKDLASFYTVEWGGWGVQGFPTGGTRTPKGYKDPWVIEQLIYLL